MRPAYLLVALAMALSLPALGQTTSPTPAPDTPAAAAAPAPAPAPASTSTTTTTNTTPGPKEQAFEELYQHPNKGHEAFKLKFDHATLSMNLLGQVQVAPWVQNGASVDNGDAATTEGFRLRRARVGFYGSYMDQLDVNLVVDLRDPDGGGTTIAAANLMYKPWSFFNVVVGTAPLPFSRGAMSS